MKATNTVIALILLFFLLTGPASGAVKHADVVASYEGTKTCAACHEKAVREVVESLHYQQLAEAKLLKDWPKGKLVGMMVSY